MAAAEVAADAPLSRVLADAVQQRAARSASPCGSGPVLARWPSAEDVRKVWEEHWKPDDLDKRDCVVACNHIAKQMGVDDASGQTPLFRISKDNDEATPTEAKQAYSRGFRYRDRVVTDGAHEYLRVYSGVPPKHKIRRYPLLPGMLIYTAESAGWKDKERGTYRWYLRHMQMYGGNGVVYENWLSPTEPRGPRTLLEGADSEDKDGAYGRSGGSKFVVTLAIYDPFLDQRTEKERELIDFYRKLRSE